MSDELLAKVCNGTNINLVIASFVLTLIVEWWLPKSRLKANSIGDLLVFGASLAIMLVVVVITAIFRRIHGTGTRKTGNQGN